MSLCRAASQALAARLSRAPAAASRLKQRAPPRQMSSGSVPGSSRDSMMIYLLAGVAAFGGLFYKVMEKRWKKSLEQRRPRKKLRQHLLWNLLHRRRVLDPHHRMRPLGYPQKLEGRMIYWLQRNPMLWRKHSRKLLLIRKLMLIWNLLLIQKLLQFKFLRRRRQLKKLLKSPKVSSVDAFGKFNANICGNQPADSCVKPHTLP